MENIFENFTIAILKLNKLVQKIKIFEMEEYGLKSIHVMCCYYLNCHPTGLTATELSKLTLEDKAAISRALGQLRDRGYVRYDTKKYNAEINLTEDGKIVAESIIEKSNRAVNAGSISLTEEERTLFYKSLECIAKNLEAYYESLINDQDISQKKP